MEMCVISSCPAVIKAWWGPLLVCWKLWLFSSYFDFWLLYTSYICMFSSHCEQKEEQESQIYDILWDRNEERK